VCTVLCPFVFVCERARARARVCVCVCGLRRVQRSPGLPSPIAETKWRISPTVLSGHEYKAWMVRRKLLYTVERTADHWQQRGAQAGGVRYCRTGGLLVHKVLHNSRTVVEVPVGPAQRPQILCERGGGGGHNGEHSAVEHGGPGRGNCSRVAEGERRVASAAGHAGQVPT